MVHRIQVLFSFQFVQDSTTSISVDTVIQTAINQVPNQRKKYRAKKSAIYTSNKDEGLKLNNLQKKRD